MVLHDPGACASVVYSTIAAAFTLQRTSYRAIFLKQDLNLKWLVGTVFLSFGFDGGISHLSKWAMATEFAQLLPFSAWLVLNLWSWYPAPATDGMIPFRERPTYLAFQGL
jgi:hypothetical protein